MIFAHYSVNSQPILTEILQPMFSSDVATTLKKLLKNIVWFKS